MIRALPDITKLLVTILICAPATAHGQPIFDPSEAHPGGNATSILIEPSAAFSGPVSTLPAPDLSEFKKGSTLFYTRWVAKPANPPALQGLGPLYNALSCEQCHRNDGRGRPPTNGLFETEVTGTVAQFIQLKSEYGEQLQDRAVAGLKPEGQLMLQLISREWRYTDGLKFSLTTPFWSIKQATSLSIPNTISVRTAPAIFGLGLLEAIPDSHLESLADPDDYNGDGISGVRGIGRFGWRATQDTLLQQTAHALLIDMGVSSKLYPQTFGDCTPHQTDCRALAGDGIEANEKFLQSVTDYVANLGPPPRYAEPKIVNRGRSIFYTSKCDACHTPSHKTGSHRFSWLSGQTIWPYTDLLLHDMGEGLADGGGREWRTPPLWGLGRHKEVNGNANYLHDGRAMTIEQAVLWHGGEAEQSRRSFTRLNASDREALIAFLKSL